MLAKLKNEPVVIVAIIVVTGMMVQNILAGEPIEEKWGDWVWTFVMSFVAREFVVPISKLENEEGGE